MSKDNLRNSNNLQEIFNKMSVHTGPLHLKKSETKRKSMPNNKKDTEKNKTINTEMILNSLDNLPMAKQKEKISETKEEDLEKKENIKKSETKKEQINPESDVLNQEAKEEIKSKKEIYTTRGSKKEKKKLLSESKSIRKNSGHSSESYSGSISSESVTSEKKTLNKHKRQRSKESGEEDIDTSSKYSIDSEYVEQINEIAQKEIKKKKKNNSEYLKKLLKPKKEKKNFVGERKKCKICGREISKKGENYHIGTKHKGKGLKDIEKENCIIEYSKRRIKRIGIILNDIDNMRKDLKIDGTHDYNLFLRNMNKMRESCNSIINIKKRKTYHFSREAQGKIPI